jgi:phage shock protein C
MSMWTAIVLIVLIGVAGGVASEFVRGKKKNREERELRGFAQADLDALRARVEVLEKIVTDEGFDLRRELDRLERTA